MEHRDAAGDETQGYVHCPCVDDCFKLMHSQPELSSNERIRARYGLITKNISLYVYQVHLNSVVFDHVLVQVDHQRIK